jgi:hypothetical protein
VANWFLYGHLLTQRPRSTEIVAELTG